MNASTNTTDRKPTLDDVCAIASAFTLTVERFMRGSELELPGSIPSEAEVSAGLYALRAVIVRAEAA